MSCQFVKEYEIEDPSVCDKLIEYFDSHPDVTSADNKNNFMRKDAVLYVRPEVAWMQGIYKLIVDTIEPSIRQYGDDFDLWRYDPHEGCIKIQKTLPGGGFHTWHCEDTGPTIAYASRKAVWTLYLNDVEEGGETEFLHQSLRVPAKKGKLAIFPTTYTHMHRGNPPLSGVKYIATGWLHHNFEEYRNDRTK